MEIKTIPDIWTFARRPYSKSGSDDEEDIVCEMLE
jgi:hypothetical protein